LPGPVSKEEPLKASSLLDQVIDDAMRFVDVMKSAVTKTPDGRVIFFPSNVIVSFIQQVLGAVKAPGAIHSCIDWRMIVQILAVVNRSTLNFFDSFVDLVYCVLFLFIHVMRGSQVFQMSASVPQIGKRVQVCRMLSRFVSKTQGSAHSNKKYEQGAMSCNFHGFLEASR
jgi:hypothetical protein